MKLWTRLCGVLLFALGGLAQAETPQEPAAKPPVTVEYYYRIKWGALDEFVTLYKRNHAPLLVEMQKLGLVREVRMQEPFTHMAGGTRWDLRVTIVYPDAASALPDPGWDKHWAEAKKRIYTDQKKFEAEEKQRFSLLEEHWDVMVLDVKE
jgi:hypothetical protein